MIGFHRVLISAGIIFCVGFATYAWYRGQVTLSIVFGVLAVVLVAYLWNLSRVLGYRDE